MIRKILLASAVLAMAVMTKATAWSQAATAPTGDVAKGKKLYSDVGCYQCHSYVGQGGAGARLAPNPIPYPAFLKYIREPKGQMPPYTDKYLKDADVADIYAYLQTIPKPPDWKTLPQLKD